MGGGRGTGESTGGSEVAGPGADAERPGRRRVHDTEPLDQGRVRGAPAVAARYDQHIGGGDLTKARGCLQDTQPGVVDDDTGPGGHEHAADARCGGQDLEGSHHVKCGEPGVEQVDNPHVFSLGPRGATHQDTLLTMSATAFQAYRRHMDTR